jgi:hypothetical protein
LGAQGQLEEFIWRALAMHKTAISHAEFSTNVREPNTVQPLGARTQHFARYRTRSSLDARKIKMLKGFAGSRTTAPIGFRRRAD